MPRPLDESYESSSDDDDDALRVDAAFAKAYSAREQKRLDARRAASGDGVLDAGGASSSDSESSDDDVPISRLRVQKYAVGDRIEADWKSEGEYFPGRVAAAKKAAAEVRDEWIKLKRPATWMAKEKR